MELRQLRAFTLAAQTLNFSEAAEKMCVTNSTFSQTIKNLEAELHTELFHRTSHAVTLTEAGQEILPFALNTLQQAQYCQDRIHDLNNLQCGTLRLGITHSFKTVASEAIMYFLHTYPKIELIVYYKPADELLDMLVCGDVDCVLSYKPYSISDRIVSHTLFDDGLAAIVNPAHPLAQYNEITIDQLQNHTLVLPTNGMQARNILNYLCSQQGITLTPKLEINEVSPLLYLVYSEKLVTVLSQSSVKSEKALRAIPIRGTHGLMTGSYHLLKDAYRKQSLKTFIEILCHAFEVHNRIDQ